MSSSPWRGEVGKKAEEEALQWFLLRHRAVLVCRNFRCRWGEIDLIFEETLPERNLIELVFVEVRSCSDRNWLSGPETIHTLKKKRMVRTAEFYLARYRGTAQTLRFDLLYRDNTTWSHLQHLW